MVIFIVPYLTDKGARRGGGVKKTEFEITSGICVGKFFNSLKTWEDCI